jgi:hypothetical protein
MVFRPISSFGKIEEEYENKKKTEKKEKKEVPHMKTESHL